MKTKIQFRVLIALVLLSCGCWKSNASSSNEAVHACPVLYSPSGSRLGLRADISNLTVKDLESLCDDWASMGFGTFAVVFQGKSFKFHRGIISEHVAPLENVPVECFVFSSNGVSNVSCRFERSCWRKQESFDESDDGVSFQCVVERSLPISAFAKEMLETLDNFSGFSFLAFSVDSFSIDDVPAMFSEGRQLRWDLAD